jgi:uncharacterized protein with HEPN domain
LTDKSSRDRLRVIAMIEAAEEAKADAAAGRDEFNRGGLVQKAVLLDLIHLTESADGTSSSFKKLNPRVPWKRLSRLRNEGLVHDYIQVNLDDVWAFVSRELPAIRRLLNRVRYSEGDD